MITPSPGSSRNRQLGPPGLVCGGMAEVHSPIRVAADFPAATPATRRLWSATLCLAALFVTPGKALAQDNDRGGFTFLVNGGYAVQHDSASGRSGDGQAGLNLGIGGFLTRNLALMFRVSGTTVRSEAPVLGELDQASGVLGGTLQYWVSDRIAVEAGGGVGFVEDLYQADSPGLILGTTATIFNRGKHSLQIGIEYAPAFRQSGTISNVGFTIGYQFL